MADITVNNAKHRFTLTANTAQRIISDADDTTGAERMMDIINFTPDAGQATDLYFRFDGVDAVVGADNNNVVPGGERLCNVDLGQWGDKSVSFIATNAVQLSVIFHN